MSAEEIIYISNFIEEVKKEMLNGKYNYNTELYLQLLRCKRYLSKVLKELEESKVKNE